jgi:hypothetical protein
MDSVKNAVKIEFVSKPMEKTQNELLTKNVICNDSYLTVKDKGFVKGIAIASGSERKIYSTSANFSLCYVNVFVDIKGENTFKLDLDKVKLVDNLDVEYPVFGISASSFNEIKIDTRTEYSGGKTANIDFEVAYNSNISHINLHHIIGKYNLNGTTVTNNGSVIINLIERGTLSIFAGEKKNFIHLSKTPNDFTLAFIVPESSNLFELKINNQAYSIPLPINTSGRNILAYDERTNQAKGGSQLVITSNGVKPVESGDIFLENTFFQNQTLRFEKLLSTEATPGAYLISNEKESFEIVDIIKGVQKTTVFPSSNFRLITEEKFTGNSSSVLLLIREYGEDGIQRKFSVNKYVDYEVFKDLANGWSDQKTKDLSSKDFMVRAIDGRKVISSIENPSLAYDLELDETISKTSKPKQTITEKPGTQDKEPNIKSYDSRWPHKKAIAIEMGYLMGAELIGNNETLLTTNENDFLESLGLIWQETSNGVITTSKPIDTYLYSGGTWIGGFRISYYLNTKFAIGGSFKFYNYAQSLTIGDDIAEGELANFSIIGPNFNYHVYNKKRFGITLKSDISIVNGNIESIPALKIMNDKNVFSGIPGLPNLIENRNKTATINGFHFNAGISANYYIARWFNINAGFHVNFFQAEASEIIWSNTSRTFSNVSIPFYFGMNFLIKNK